MKTRCQYGRINKKMNHHHANMEELTLKELVHLVKSVFPHLPNDRVLAILVDLPKESGEENQNWGKRRQLVAQWAKYLQESVSALQLERVELIAYSNVGSNNANLPEMAYIVKDVLPLTAEDLTIRNEPILFTSLFSQAQIFIAVTEYSATAPLKIAAHKYGFRAATMPGFSTNMIPALRLDYGKVNHRVQTIKAKLDVAESAEVIFEVDKSQKYTLLVDLRFRSGHASSGRFPEAGVAGNLPGGEAYIVPYEGENKDTPSRTEGTLPVQLENEIVLYKIQQNRVVRVSGEGEASKAEGKHVAKEQGYANIAELGFGVLADFGIKPTGEILLDEKLGFHIAFGRSDHFGGSVGPSMFSSPQAVVHIDRIYLPTTQPRVSVKSVTLHFKDQHSELLMENGKYVIFSV
jgi:hypothetical protein